MIRYLTITNENTENTTYEYGMHCTQYILVLVLSRTQQAERSL